MVQTIKLILWLVLLPITTVTSAAQENQIKYEAELRLATTQWVDTYNRNDWTALAKQFTEEAVMMPPNSPAVRGREAIAAWESANETGFRIALKPNDITLIGDTAIIRGRSCVFIPVSEVEGGMGVDVGKYLEIRQRTANGDWLVSQDIFNSDLPVGSPLASACPVEISGQAGIKQ